MQRMILGLLNGTETPMVSTVSDRWTTAELVDELVEHKLLDESQPRDWSNGAEIAVGWTRKEPGTPSAAC